MTATKTVNVYILKMSNNKYYTGMTQDIRIRMKQHNAGHSKSTRYYRPLKLIFLTLAKDRKTARRLEVKIKNRGARKYLLDQTYKYNRTYNNILGRKEISSVAEERRKRGVGEEAKGRGEGKEEEGKKGRRRGRSEEKKKKERREARF